MRRFCRIIFIILAALLLAILTSPWWLSIPLRPLLARNNIVYGTYSTNGYSRFVLTDLRVTTPAADVTVARVEADTPWLLVLRRFISKPGSVEITDWHATIKPTPAAPATEPSETSPTGLVPTLTTLNTLRDQITPWLPSLRLSNGKITSGKTPLTISLIDWQSDTTRSQLEIPEIAYQGHTASATVTLENATAAIHSKIRNPQSEITLTLADSTLTGTLNVLSQTATLTARFPETGWLPTEALLDAPALSLTAEQLARFHIPSEYTAATGNARIAYREHRFTADITAHAEPSTPGTPSPSSASDKSALLSAPPLDITLQAQGTPDQINITALNITLPGLHARLASPITITRDLRVLSGDSRFTLEADLAQQPWLRTLSAQGSIKGEITLTPNAADISATADLRATARLTATDIRVADIAISRLTLSATQENLRTRLDTLDLQLADGSTLAATARYDAATRTFADTTLNARILPGVIARWLPPETTFDSTTLALALSGPDTNLAHTGTLEIKNARTPTLAKPAHITADWKGRAATADILNFKIVAASTELRLSAADISAERATITALTLRKNDADILTLSAPAQLTILPNNSLALTPLTLIGDSSIFSAHFTRAQTSTFGILAKNIPSTWFSDLVNTGPFPWQITSTEISATLPAPDAALTATLSLDARIDYAQTLPSGATGLPESALINASATLTPESLDITHLNISETESRSLIAQLSGSLPITIRPGVPDALTIDKTAPLSLDAHTQPDSPFWQNFANATGIILASPRINAHLDGTLQKPTAYADLAISSLTFDPTRWPKFLTPRNALPKLPPLTELNARLSTDGTTLNLETLSVHVAAQPIKASAQFDLDKNLIPKLHTLNLTTNADLSALAPFSNSLLAPRGRLSAELTLTRGQPLTGQLQLRDAALRPVPPLGTVNDINATARFTGSRLEITSATALLGNQPATLTGTIDFPDFPLSSKKSEIRNPKSEINIVPNLTLKATNIPFVREPGLLVRGDLDLRIKTMDTTNAAPSASDSDKSKIQNPKSAIPLIQGTVTLRDSLFLADLRSLWSSRPASGPASRPPFFAIETPPLKDWLLDIDIRGNRFIRVDTTVFTGKLSAAFKLDGTLGDPRIIGDATVDSGKVLFPFATFTTQTGRVRLTQASPHMPRIEFSATTRTLGYDLRMEVVGTAENPRLSFTSNPALSSEQILLFVMAGETPSNENDYTNQQRALSLGTYLGQSIVYEILGLSTEEGRLSLTSGEKLTRQGRETYNVEYKLADRWAAVGEYDEFDAYNLGLKWLAYRSKLYPPTNSSTETKAKDTSPSATVAKTESPKTKPPKVKVTGHGWWANIGHTRMLQRTLALNETHAPTLNANEIEDAAFLLVSQLTADGYMHPKIEITTPPAPGETGDAEPQVFTSDETLDLTLPRELAAQKAHFKITPGVLYKLRDVTFKHTGPAALTDTEARNYFLPSDSLFGDSSIPYSPAALKSAISSLQQSLKQKGYAQATATVSDLNIDDTNGRVTAQINITAGPLWKISTLKTTATTPDSAPSALQPLETKLQREYVAAGKAWSQWTQQDIAEEVRQHYFKLGHPDVQVQVTATPLAGSAGHQPGTSAGGAITPIAVSVSVTPGPQVRIGAIELVGNRHTRESIIRRRIARKTGDLLNPAALESSRHRLGSLGVFRTIDVEIAPAGAPVRDVRFLLTESPQTELNLLVGWGSYEQLRGGIEVRRHNFLGIADETRLQLIKSVKSERGDLTFGVPDLFARGINGSIRAFGLRREEIAFERVEYGGTATLRRAWAARGYEVTAGYTYESLNSTDDTLSPEAGDAGRTIAAAINLSISRDKRDNPLSPKRGYNWYLQGEFASHYFGGQADYQRYRAGFVYHTAWGRTRWIHAGISQGLILPFDGKDTPLPVNKLFYPGGENSIRGYQDGEAAPRDADGAFLGAKVYTLLNLEVEQALVGSLNFVVFYDLMGDSAAIADYPGTEWLHSAGIGFRYHTILGPLRLEYGRNLNPRTGDPSGTLHFSVGIPF